MRGFPLKKPLIQVGLACLLTVFMLPGNSMAQESEQSPQQRLADILEDETARAELINNLRSASGAEGESEQALATSEAPVPFSRVLANTTQAYAQSLVSDLSSALNALSDLGSQEQSIDYAALSEGGLNLVLVIVATLLVFVVLRRLARPLFNQFSVWAQKPATGSALLRRSVAVIGAAGVDFIAVALAWVTGYAVALFVVGAAGEMDARESLFLNAFLMIEVFKALIRIVLASRDDGLRLIPIRADDAAYWNAWLARLSSFIGYGVMLVAPIASASLSPAVGALVTLMVMLVAFLYALMIILQNRIKVADKLSAAADRAGNNGIRFGAKLLSRSWHLLAIIYFAALALVTMVRPEDALPLMLQATVQMVVAIGAGVFFSVVLTQIVRAQVHISDEHKRRFPMLEARLNGFIPVVLKVIHVLVMVTVVAVILDAWGLFNLGQWLASETGTAVILKLVTVGIILTVVKAFWIVIASWIEHRLNPDSVDREPTSREVTLLTIFRNAIAVALIILTLMIVLAEIGINIGPLIAGAGVLGLAIGFGAQKLVQDIITGIFIQMENAINAGDVVTAGGITGVAEKLTIRSLGIRDLSGTYHMIPFSSVDSVSNYMRDFAFHVGEYGVAYRENTDEVIMRLREAFEELKTDPDHEGNLLSDELEVHGVTALADSSVNVRVRIKTAPGVQWAVGRAYNRLVKQHLDAAGIEIPFPHTTIYFGQDKDGTAPAAPIRVEQERQPGQPGVDPGKARTNPKDKGDFDEADD